MWALSNDGTDDRSDPEAALVAIAVNLVGAVIVLPVYLSALVGTGVGFEPTQLSRQLAIVVVVPMVAENLTRRALLRRYSQSGFKQLKPLFGDTSSFGVRLIVFIAMAMQSESILADPLVSAVTVVPLVLFYAIVLAYLLQPPLGALYMHYRRDFVDEGRSIKEPFRSLTPR